MLRFILILLAFTTLVVACEQLEINGLDNEVMGSEMSSLQNADLSTIDANSAKGQDNESHRKGNPNVDLADLPGCILDYVSMNYPGAVIVKAQLKRGEYVVRLDNDTKLGFEVDGTGTCTLLFAEEDEEDDTEDDTDDTDDDTEDDTDDTDDDTEDDTDDTDDDTEDDTDDTDDDTEDDTDDTDDDTEDDTDDTDDDTEDDTDDTDDDTEE